MCFYLFLYPLIHLYGPCPSTIVSSFLGSTIKSKRFPNTVQKNLPDGPYTVNSPFSTSLTQ